jgi:predicted dehydrogenase
MEKIRVGVVGVGYFGQFHAEKYSRMEGVELIGLVDVDPSRAREVAQRFRTHRFSKTSDLYGKIQAVSIAVPTHLHHSIARDFFLQGIDVLLEKPIATTVAEANELIQLAESKNLIFQVGHLERFNGALSAVGGILQNPFMIESYRTGPYTGRGIDVDVVLDLMVHDIDIVLSLVPSNVKYFHASGKSVVSPTLDIAHAQIEFENGCRANLVANRVSEEKVRKARILQPDGILSLDYLHQTASFSRNVASPGKERAPETIPEQIPIQKVDLLERETHSFIESVRNRKTAHVSGKDGKRALEVALQILEKINGPGERRASIERPNG